MEWISVKDKLPKGMGDMPCYVLHGSGYAVKATWYADERQSGFYLRYYIFFEKDAVTHWAPLP